jgi:hypothetical protein
MVEFHHSFKETRVISYYSLKPFFPSEVMPTKRVHRLYIYISLPGIPDFSNFIHLEEKTLLVVGSGFFFFPIL